MSRFIDRFTISRTMSKAYYDCCMQGNIEAFECYLPMKTALADLQSGYGSIMDAAELSAMNITKRDLIPGSMPTGLTWNNGSLTTPSPPSPLASRLQHLVQTLCRLPVGGEARRLRGLMTLLLLC